MKSKKIIEMLFYFSLIFIMVMSLNLAIMDCTGMDMTLVRMGLITLIITTVTSLLAIFPITAAAALIPGIGWLLYLYYTDLEAIKLYAQKTKEFFIWLNGYVAGYIYFEEGYSLVFAILFTTLAALVTSLIVYSGRGGFALILLGTASLSFFWFIYVEKAKLYLSIFLFSAIMLYSYQIYKKRLKNWTAADSIIEHNVGQNWMLCSVVVVALSIMLSFALPLNISPVRWPWLNDKFVSLFPFIAEWRNDSMESFSYGFNSRFSLNSAGYNIKKLGGEVHPDASILMTVKTKGEDTLYLRGAVKDKYIGNSWYKTKKDYKEYKPGDSMTLPFGADINTYEKEMEITYKKLMTSTVFATYSIYQVQHYSKKIYADEDSEVYTSKMTMKADSYKVKSIMPYLDVEKLRQAKAESLEINEYRQCTAIDSNIPERVRLLAQNITRAQNNNYDKAKAIEKYLRENYKYTLKPPKLPSKAEFTDHFLFDGKEGYCTYFATSMSVLLRAAGVPGRYVEGFIARYSGDGEREVSGTDAHAWVEVYFDDYGWVTFEPTPQYPEIEFAKPLNGAEAVNPDIVQDTRVGNIDMSGFARHRGDLEDRENVGNGEMYLNGQNKRFNIGSIIFFMFLSLLIIRFIFMYILWVMKEVSLGRLKGRKFVMDYLENIMWYLRHAGFEMNKDETLREFLKRVKYYYKERFSDITNVTLLLEKIRYSDYELSNEERTVLEIFRKNVKQFAFKEAGVIKFFMSLYILGR